MEHFKLEVDAYDASANAFEKAAIDSKKKQFHLDLAAFLWYSKAKASVELLEMFTVACKESFIYDFHHVFAYENCAAIKLATVQRYCETPTLIKKHYISIMRLLNELIFLYRKIRHLFVGIFLLSKGFFRDCIPCAMRAFDKTALIYHMSSELTLDAGMKERYDRYEKDVEVDKKQALQKMLKPM